MRVELPGGWADIAAKDEVTERDYRLITKAETKAMGLGIRLNELKFDLDFDSLTSQEQESKYEDFKERRLFNFKVSRQALEEFQDEQDDYNSALIVGLTRTWSFGPVSSDALLDLPHDVIEALAKYCQDELRGTVIDTDPDPNPVAPTAA